MAGIAYTNEQRNEISFPLGGIGTGCIGLSGTGRLIDWEIFNRPNKGSTFGFSHFAVKAESADALVDARVLNADLAPPYSGSLRAGAFGSYGFGVRREYLTGMPHFRDSTFNGRYPVADVEFRDDAFPGSVGLQAFSPFIPLNDADSGIPAAFFALTFANPTDQPLTYTAALSVKNPGSQGRNLSRYHGADGVHSIQMVNNEPGGGDPAYGDITIATDADAVSYQQYWYRGSWFDNLAVFWHDFATTGRFTNRVYEASAADDGVAYGKDDHATIAGRVVVAPGERRTVRFVIAWNYPNVTNYWNPEPPKTCDCSAGDGGCDCGGDCDGGGDGACQCGDGCRCAPRTWKNYYATLFADSLATATYALSDWARLYAATEQFAGALFDCTLPPAVLDAVSANLSILKSPTVLRLEDGTFYGFEGCHPDAGCCEGSCTHVWNYAYALPFLFPKLERTMRDADYRYNLADDGGMAFRLQLPLGRQRSGFRPCADGQFGGVMKMYRDWKLCGDNAWLARHWPAIKSNVEYAWSPENPDRWDRDRDGVLEGRQHHTLDMELFGPNSWLTGFYLGALVAAAEMADAVGDSAAAADYRALFASGSAWVDNNLFNGDYFNHQIDISDKNTLQPFAADEREKAGYGALWGYWSAEHNQLKYQVADGCAVDQVVAQWHANLIGLPRIFDRAKTLSALQSIYRHNFKRARDIVNPCRIYATNDERCLIICAFPNSKPVIPVPYAEEAMNGFEYQAACHMIQEGLVEEGVAVVQALRERYDGVARNPWNEFECGSNYARSMASFALVPTFSGFSFDMVEGYIGFAPIDAAFRDGECRSLFSVDAAWGRVRIGAEHLELQVEGGSLTLAHLGWSRCVPGTTVRVSCPGSATISGRVAAGARPQRPATIHFGLPITIGAGHTISIHI